VLGGRQGGLGVELVGRQRRLVRHVVLDHTHELPAGRNLFLGCRERAAGLQQRVVEALDRARHGRLLVTKPLALDVA
jgi:hypothetical protein